ncbi:RsmB/NOP family class I SAM-dependent RNA methyltransferase [Paenibacillus senegalensis]|uniref:RsmB/NOP family class I SAM-dependent RNA methyltransferase n=1 Tax=Paenibacillus senegalensis TaxID=1465766 RepID=UPI0002891B99|nr:RsmB/NOP family class I SAM-dependent RNA methyltransferase [Paenibacillus senegalensis]
MNPELPPLFIQRIRRQLGEDADAFLHSYKEPRTFGLRLNPLKLSASDENFDYIKTLFGLEPVPWCPTGYYYEEASRPGKHPFHQAGLYYIQEPSAMSAVELLAPRPGETVLDLAAAPGGKASQIAGKMQGQGLLIANEIHPGRARILSENFERMGVANAVVTQAAPDELAARFPAFFERILLDAPCSGEGMFRKDAEAIGEWSPQHVDYCAVRQLDVIRHAVTMLKPGGVLVYSTCTFSEEENEGVIEQLLEQYPGLELLKTERLWPHRHRGEGHFAAVLRLTAGGGAARGAEPQTSAAEAFRVQAPRRSAESAVWHTADSAAAGADPHAAGAANAHAASAADAHAAGAAVTRADGRSHRAERRRQGRSGRGKAARHAARRDGAALEAYELYKLFAGEAELPIPADGDGEPLLFGEQLYWLPTDRQQSFSSSSLRGLKALRPGLHLGTVRKGRLEPAHALALSLPPAARNKAFGQQHRLEPEGREVLAYLRGETLASAHGLKGWTLITVAGYPLGWAKASNGQLKNHYPKGLRLR